MSVDSQHRHPKAGAFFYGWVIAICSTLITVINGGVFYTFGVFFKPVAHDFGWSRAEFSMTYTAMLVAYAPGSFFSGRLADRHGPRGVLMLSALLIGLGFFAASRANNLAVMTLGYVAIGVGIGSTLAVPTATIQRWFVKLRAPMVGLVVAGTGIGGFVFAPVTNYLIASHSWRTAYLAMAIIYGAVVAVCGWFMAGDPRARAQRPFGEAALQDAGTAGKAAVSKGFSLAQAFKTRAFIGLIAISILGFTPSFFISVHLVPYVTDQGIDPATAAGAMGMVGLVSVAGRILMSWAAGRFGWMKSMGLSYAITALSAVLLAFVARPHELFVFVVVYGFFWGSTLALFSGAVGYMFGMTALSELLGFLLGLSVAIGAIGPLLGGLSYDVTGSYLTAIAVAAASYTATALVCFLLKPPAR